MANLNYGASPMPYFSLGNSWGNPGGSTAGFTLPGYVAQGAADVPAMAPGVPDPARLAMYGDKGWGPGMSGDATAAYDLGLGTGPAIDTPDQGGFFSNFIGNRENPGWGGMALGAAGGLASAYLGFKQYGLAKQSLDESRKQFSLNFGAQQKLTNARLEDRQQARVSSGAPGAYESVGSYMDRNRVG